MLRIIRFSEAKRENFIAMSVEHLLNKDILIYPTDTSYGVGTLFNDQSIDKLNLLKSRPSGKYYSAIVPNIEWIKENLEVNTIQLNILNKYLRGEYTFILNVKYSKKTLGIRIPDYDLVNRIASKIVKLVLGEFGAGGGSRTHMILRPQDFESCASAIPPPRLLC